MILKSRISFFEVVQQFQSQTGSFRDGDLSFFDRRKPCDDFTIPAVIKGPYYFLDVRIFCGLAEMDRCGQDHGSVAVMSCDRGVINRGKRSATPGLGLNPPHHPISRINNPNAPVSKNFLKSSAPPRVSPMAILESTERLSSLIPSVLVRKTGSSIQRIPI